MRGYTVSQFFRSLVELIGGLHLRQGRHNDVNIPADEPINSAKDLPTHDE
jgi:hypothetical protein